MRLHRDTAHAAAAKKRRNALRAVRVYRAAAVAIVVHIWKGKVILIS